jgi:hypothetical protein
MLDTKRIRVNEQKLDRMLDLILAVLSMTLIIQVGYCVVVVLKFISSLF